VIRNAFEEVKSVVVAQSVPLFELSCRCFSGDDEIGMLLSQDLDLVTCTSSYPIGLCSYVNIILRLTNSKATQRAQCSYNPQEDAL
jgi:hypothetical protein